MFRTLIMLLLAASTSSLTTQRNNISKDIQTQRSCLKPWTMAFDALLKRSTKNGDLQRLRQIYDRAILVKIAPAREKRGYEYLDDTSTEDWLGLLPICEVKSTPEPWQDVLRIIHRGAQYEPRPNVILLRSDLPMPELVRGLILVRELYVKSRLGNRRATNAGVEVDAYEFQFGILDDLNLPGYKESIRDDMPYIMEDHTNGQYDSLNLTNPRLPLMFPDVKQHEVAYYFAGQLIYKRTLFRVFELMYKGSEARKAKERFGIM
ncbi:MAG: hypothetical protein UW43_C0003G0020 [Candidatus Yanofskybacteria bacterium GW2011_GWA1_44_21]|uniref:Uncharacterized protein n=2 Tax=Candidatus Yanofskyibacteriota TaxID=1752733 RepID=A0A1F8H147_9BACT|nr:MAG: hypothetical protein UW14_C0008G0011 [Candidatus Yanofskybacteria bacterium GW2011_GWA2_44_10]KKT50678.1 MAG: hypothetical protein UW43_C0003G0020 [Candidatus Yanofskybacteria bacterium GW2011_GWA1_44_21]KKT90206.1 MAG: hypothetical protein UW90_C0004G0011 [Candidatus Yanofskybacteria bacterium GW2011_GWB1_45_11]OGN02230.1 MAG: hypothetical protein A2657_02635 [Candidatus Yanofskybacteria bacterium RIFCSPHIGHO2_01_FULL_44_110b]OGN14857.1 MAG: hypothetical protein A3C01_02530 [Candidatus